MNRTAPRRDFIASMACLAAFAPPLLGGAGSGLKAAIIGHTGAGNYGHGLDTIFKGLPGVETVAVADPDAAGRERAVRASGAARGHADFREMLAAEKPNLVSVAPRWSEGHFEMAKAALEAGAHLICEKPFTNTPAEADQLLELAARKRLRIAVAHQMRMAPNVEKLRREIAGGLIGELVQMQAFGKQDARAGGEDMMVLGTHLFDLMRLFAGEARRCSATVWWQGRLAARADRRRATEKIGPILGDEIAALFEFEGGVTGTFTSRARLRERVGRWRLDLVGSKGTARILMDIDPDVKLQAGEQWVDFAPVAAEARGFPAANRRVAVDWLKAIEEGREPICSGANGAKAVEMAMAAYTSHLAGRRVELPLESRKHPLGDER